MVEIYGEPICSNSFEEMEKFVRRANQLGEKPLLFGGWAVYNYNPYAGSKDVDFVVSDENFDQFVDFLVKGGYAQRQARLYKGEVFFDLYKKSEDIGSEDSRIPLRLLYDGAEPVYLRRYSHQGGRGEVLLPSESSLLFFKIYALAARSVPKDRSDVIAVLLKAPESQLEKLGRMLSPKLKDRLVTLLNDSANLALVAKPTKRNMTALNRKIRQVRSFR